jgi:hypothetical protein
MAVMGNGMGEARPREGAPEVSGSRPKSAHPLRVIDPLTGQPLNAREQAYREQILRDREQGLIAIDADYAENSALIHDSKLDRSTEAFDEGFVYVIRGNATTYRVALDRLGNIDSLMTDPMASATVAYSIVAKVLGEPVAELMRQLYIIANDPPYYRRPKVTISITELVRRVGYKPDNRGVVRSDARRRVNQALLALHYTHISLQVSGKNGTIGRSAPLISELEYSTREDVSHLAPSEIFDRGLPDEVTITLGWFGTIRDKEGLPVGEHALIPVVAYGSAAEWRRGGRGKSIVSRLRVGLLEYGTAPGPLQLSKGLLLRISAIADKDPWQATRTLARALDKLVAEGTLDGYSPIPLPSREQDLLILDWTGRVVDAFPGDVAPPSRIGRSGRGARTTISADRVASG